MAIRGMQSQAVDTSELLDLLQRLCRERRLAFKGMEHNPFEQISQRHVLQFSDRLQYLEQLLLDADAGLDPFHLHRSLRLWHMYQCTMVYRLDFVSGTVLKFAEKSHR